MLTTLPKHAKIEIKCKGAGTIKLKDFIELQGNLKDLSEESFEKFSRELIEDGFSEPISIWEETNTKRPFILNGHQRVRTLNKLKEMGWEVPEELPVSYIEADTEKQARRKCLSLAGQYGKVTDHATTRWHAARFGNGLKKRPPSEAAPTEIAPKEVRYVEQLYAAYGDQLKKNISSKVDLDGHDDLIGHFDRQRTHFYEAESLKQFARDSSLPDGNHYDDLLNEFYNGVIDVLNKTHRDGYEKLIEVVQMAQKIQLGSHVLVSVLRTGDRIGVCHQLANEDRLKWVK